MCVSFIILLLLNKFGFKSFTPYLLVGLFLWYFTYGSGIHSTISGVLLAVTIPHRLNEKDFSLLLKLEHLLSPYVAFGIMPLFAFANAGVVLEGITFKTLLNPVPLGILCGLFFGKQIGFTMSLFVGNLAFYDYADDMSGVKIGVLSGSFLSAIVGYFLLLIVGKKK